MSLDTVIAVSFDEDRSAYEAFTNLKELDEQRQVCVRSAAIVERDEQGRVTTKDEVEALKAKQRELRAKLAR